MFFDKIEAAPADPILGLGEAFKAETRSNKVNLGIGVYKDAKGNTPIPKAVKEAETRLLANENNKMQTSINKTPHLGRYLISDISILLSPSYILLIILDKVFFISLFFYKVETLFEGYYKTSLSPITLILTNLIKIKPNRKNTPIKKAAKRIPAADGKTIST